MFVSNTFAYHCINILNKTRDIFIKQTSGYMSNQRKHIICVNIKIKQLYLKFSNLYISRFLSPVHYFYNQLFWNIEYN